jgi:hypothetical protein
MMRIVSDAGINRRFTYKEHQGEIDELKTRSNHKTIMRRLSGRR